MYNIVSHHYLILIIPLWQTRLCPTWNSQSLVASTSFKHLHIVTFVNTKSLTLKIDILAIFQEGNLYYLKIWTIGLILTYNLWNFLVCTKKPSAGTLLVLVLIFYFSPIIFEDLHDEGVGFRTA